ncbi:MAG: ABC transporter substrate-binding protein [Chloroflexi bacterium]|nr:ABC transporter substrate-binding protein [Chloroflexota bacterium]
MKKLVYGLLASVLTISLLLGACAKPTPSPTTPPPTTPPATAPAPAPKATPTLPPPATGTPRYGGVLRVGTTTHPSTLLPTGQPLKQSFLGALFDTLLKLDKSGELQPNLATEWSFSPDKKSFTLKLRQGVKFHDGTELNAAAVKWNILERKKFRDWTEVTSVDIVDDYTVRLNMDAFTNTLLVSLWFIPGMMTSPTTFDKWGKDDGQWHPTGTGPFKLAAYQHEVVGKFVRNDGYWQKGKPYLDEFHYVMIRDSTTMELALRAGEVDAVAEGIEVDVRRKLADEGKHQVVTGTVETYDVLVPDTVNPDSPFYNKKVRDAVDYAIDRKEIAKSLGFGYLEAFNQLSPSVEYAYNKTIPGRAYDPAKAKQLLAEAGYPNGFKTKMNRPFSYDARDVAVQSYLKAVGIDAEIEITNIAQYYNLERGGWKNRLIIRAFRNPPDWLAYVDSMVNTSSIENKSWTRPTGLMDSLNKAKAATTMAEKSAAAQQMVKLIYDEAAMIPLYGTVYAVVARQGINNMGYYALWGPNELWSPADVWMSK